MLHQAVCLVVPVFLSVSLFLLFCPLAWVLCVVGLGRLLVLCVWFCHLVVLFRLLFFRGRSNFLACLCRLFVMLLQLVLCMCLFARFSISVFLCLKGLQVQPLLQGKCFRVHTLSFTSCTFNAICCFAFFKFHCSCLRSIKVDGTPISKPYGSNSSCIFVRLASYASITFLACSNSCGK